MISQCFNKQRQSVLTVGGGHGMHMFQSSRDWEKLDAITEEKTDYKHLYKDDKNGLDVYVFTENHDNEYKSGNEDDAHLGINGAFAMLQDEVSSIISEDLTENGTELMSSNKHETTSNNELISVKDEYEERYNLRLKEIQVKHDLEVLKLKKELESMRKNYLRVSSEKDLLIKTPPLPLTTLRESISSECKMNDVAVDDEEEAEVINGVTSKLSMMNGRRLSSNNNNNNNNNDNDNIPLLDKRSTDIIKRQKARKKKKAPRGFNDNDNQCVIFGWSLW